MSAAVGFLPSIVGIDETVCLCGAWADGHDADAALLVEGVDRILFGSCEGLAAYLEQYDFAHQAQLVREHDRRVGTIVVTCFADGGTLVSIAVRPALGDA